MATERPSLWPTVLIFVAVGLAALLGECVAGPQQYAKGAGVKTAMWTYAVSELSRQEKAELARYDLLVFAGRPNEIRELRSYNPEVRVLFELEPLLVWPWDGDTSAWWYQMGDYLWSPIRRWQVACWENDWYLRDTDGKVILDPAGKAWVNWTPYCPRGLTLEARGYRASEYYARMLAEIALGSSWGSPWSWGRSEGGAPNGYQFETLTDCLGSWDAERRLARADPDRDGVAEPVTASCSVGGNRELLSVLMRAENGTFGRLLRQLFPPEFVFGWNDVTDLTGPAFRFDLGSGVKLENWGHRKGWSWEDWFWGKDGCGYRLTEERMDRPGRDRSSGWDVSTITGAWEPGRSEAWNERNLRFLLGTVLLGDGYVHYHDRRRGFSRRAFWQPVFDLDLGRPMGKFRVKRVGPWSIYERRYWHYLVRVNPNPVRVAGIPAEDAVFRKRGKPRGRKDVRGFRHGDRAEPVLEPSELVR